MSPLHRPSRLLHTCGVLGLAWSVSACSDNPVALRETPRITQPTPAVLDQLVGLELDSLPAPIPTYFSPGSRTRAETLQAWLRGADTFFRERMKVSPEFRLAVLNEEHWRVVSRGPYGVPFVTDAPRVVVLPAVPERAAVTQI